MCVCRDTCSRKILIYLFDDNKAHEGHLRGQEESSVLVAILGLVILLSRLEKARARIRILEEDVTKQSRRKKRLMLYERYLNNK